VAVPDEFLPHGSRDSLVSLLDYAEEHLRCSHVIVAIRKDRKDLSVLLKPFMYLGFVLLRPVHPLVPPVAMATTPESAEVAYLAYVVSGDESGDSLA